ncbi:UDP-N-acetylglucosamine transporter TMEM241-like [Asterias amurensis]|uniref:UDP-N-acetylglucosamine transporter TMEM241-like n=1 Tax=Asterias amurensis TaxID=7602 RepID=UPI003AB7AC3C
MASGWTLVVSYCVLFVATNLTNKYVLSVLHFTYPTLFQEWQTAVGAVVLYGLASQGYYKISYDRSSVLPWLPAMMFFVLSIYSGSKALSKLAVPVFVAIQNIVEIPAYLTDNFLKNHSTTFSNKASLVTVVVAAILTWITDPQRDEEGHYWMMIHVLSSSFYSIYSTVRGPAINLSDVEKLLYCYFFSVIALFPASVILGDLMLARDFPHWYLMEFYIGCLLSGVLGAGMNLTGISVRQTPDKSLLTRLAVANAKTALVLASLVVFEGQATGDMALSVFLGVSAYSVFSVTKTTRNATKSDKDKVDHQNKEKKEDNKLESV